MKQYPHLIEAVYFQPWMITPQGFSAVHAIARRRLLGEAGLQLTEREEEMLAAQGGDRPTKDFFGNRLPQMEIVDGTAVIPIHGTLIHHAGVMERMCGAVSYDDIRADLEAAHMMAKRIVLDIASPGGMCIGCSETAALIQKLKADVRIDARTDSVIGSAAYYLAASCHSITATPTSIVGSVGAYSAILDQSRAMELEGLKVEVFKSGDVKGAGIPGTSLTEAQRADLQGRVDEYGRMFREWVSANRFFIEEADMQGQAYVGAEAKRRGFVDELLFDA
jgi:ClpP class serine protease